LSVLVGFARKRSVFALENMYINFKDFTGQFYRLYTE